jgi:NAD(P)-dependent dehydrogenase (short-subunit alcohol dehydrogenase family)
VPAAGLERRSLGALGARGARLGLIGRRLEALEAVRRVIASDSPCVKSHAFDLSDDAQIQALDQRVQKDSGGVDILVHSAGVFVQSRLDVISEAEFDRLYRVSLLAPHLLSRLLSVSLRARRGQAVLVNSSVTDGSRGGLSHYAATKVALKAVAQCLREEFNPEGVPGAERVRRAHGHAEAESCCRAGRAGVQPRAIVAAGRRCPPWPSTA